MKSAAWAAALVAALAGSATARDLESILEDKGVIDKGEKIEAQAAKESAAGPAGPVIPDWVSKVTLFGDVRVRNESFWREDTATRIRQRFRLRFGAKVKVNEETELGMRISSGNPDDPISNNQSFDDIFRFKNLDISNAYIKLALGPSLGMTRPFLTLQGGKFDMPMYQPTKLQFDGDLTPEGFFESVKLIEESDGFLRGLAISAGQFVFEETSSRSDGAIFAFQGLMNANLASGVFWNFGVADFLYHKEGKIARAVVNNEELTISNDIVLSDGTIVGGDPFDPGDLEVEDGDPLKIVGFANDFNILDLGTDLVVATGMPAFPLKFLGHYVINTEADDEDTGFQFGAGIGNTKDPGDLYFQYAYQRLETNAVMSAFTDSDFGFDGGTNREGHILQLSYVWLKNLSLVSTAWFVEKVEGDSDLEKRWQVDMVAKF